MTNEGLNNVSLLEALPHCKDMNSMQNIDTDITCIHWNVRYTYRSKSFRALEIGWSQVHQMVWHVSGQTRARSRASSTATTWSWFLNGIKTDS